MPVFKSIPALRLSEVTVNYEKTPVLWDLSCEIPTGHLCGIIGPNGAGKSTLLKTILGLIKPISGRIEILGMPLKKVRKRIGYVPQKESVDWDFPITVFELVLMGLYGKLGLFRRPSAKDKKKAWAVLKEVELEEFAHRQIDQLSGGQKQRAFIARALLQEADLYFMDEPFAGIDALSTKVVFALLQKLKQEKKTVFIVHHDLQSVESVFDWVIFLNMRLVAAGETKEVFTKKLIEETYGKDKKVLDSVAKLSSQKTRGVPIAS
ncbi:MAG: metal ABC transporter ATP-binding protein [Chlamydiia bacterium]|nr:metal ABC transporter ATP-binding protein [Chlamydiia bacterium]